MILLYNAVLFLQIMKEVTVMAFSFFGGVHPKENKHYSENCRVQDFPAPDLLVIPMQQHIGAPCQPLVKKGDRVLMGQKVGDNQGLCVPVHASVSGTVKAVEARPHTNGMTCMSVVIHLRGSQYRSGSRALPHRIR